MRHATWTNRGGIRLLIPDTLTSFYETMGGDFYGVYGFSFGIFFCFTRLFGASDIHLDFFLVFCVFGFYYYLLCAMLDLRHPAPISTYLIVYGCLAHTTLI